MSTIRKTLSTIAFKRIIDDVDAYLSASQSAYRRGRSTSDIVWTHKWLCALVQNKKESFKILGVDLSSAFDLIDRRKLSEILRNNKTQRSQNNTQTMNDTGINARFGSITTRVNTEIESFQGAGLSPILFVVYLEAALREARSQLKNEIILEMIYADDIDFIVKNDKTVESCISIINKTFRKWNLRCNFSKTEITNLERSKD